MCAKVSYTVLLTHNWFEHYIWDMYGGFGHNGKIIQHIHPSLPYSAITLQIDCLDQFSKLSALQKRNMCAKVSYTVLLAHNWIKHYIWDMYGGFGHNGKIIQRTLFPPILSHHAPN